jgi:hypothetical protein
MIEANSKQGPRSYEEFDLDTLRRQHQLIVIRSSLFAAVKPVKPPLWLPELLNKSLKLTLYSEKAKSEYIVAPLLLALKETVNDAISIYSGFHFDVDITRGLKGFCDFIISKGEPMPVIQAPVIMLVEAKKNDVDGALGQCAAEMVAAQIFNAAEQQPVSVIYGCITTGDDWQFLRLRQNQLVIDEKKTIFKQS